MNILTKTTLSKGKISVMCDKCNIPMVFDFMLSMAGSYSKKSVLGYKCPKCDEIV